MANIDNVQLPDGSSYNIVDNTSGFASQSYVDSAVSSITKTTIGLGNVDNTSDLNKPISTATQTALDTLDEDKADKTDIATVESGTTASRAYSVGELVYVSGTLYRVISDIAQGATFTVDTNIKATTIGGSISNSIFWVDANKFVTHDTTIATNSSYTAPEDGMYIWLLFGNGSNAASLYADTNRTYLIWSSLATNVSVSAVIPLRKGQTIYTRNASGTTHRVIGHFKI